MKKNFMSLLFLSVLGEGGTVLSTQTQSTGNQNTNLNPLGSRYASTYGHEQSSLIARVVRDIIYDAAPQQFLDLKILSMKPSRQVNSDEFSYQEMTFGRDAIVVATIGADIAAGVTQAIPIVDTNTVSIDTIVVYPDNKRGNVTNVDKSTSTITVTAETGSTLPVITAGVQGSTVLANLSPVEADGATAISQYYKIGTIERSNFVQAIIKAQRWGRFELEKHTRNGTLKNYIQMNKKRLYEQFRIDLSNILWNGNMAEVTLANGQKAKTAGGIFPIMQQVGSANASVTLANAPDALEQLALDTEFKQYGYTRFAYATPTLIHYLSKQYKSELTRYTPNDSIAKLGLSSIDIGSSKIVFVPVARFGEPSCFPSSWRSRLILLDQASITPVHFLPEEMGDTLNRRNGGTLNNFTDSWISVTHSLEFNNPLGSGYLDITNLP